MTDNELIDIFAGQLELAVVSGGWDFLVIQKNQPEKQGLPSTPSVFFEKLFDHRYGFPIISNTYDSLTDTFVEKNLQVYETTFQVSALVKQDPSDLAIPTASDVVNHVCMYMQSRRVISLLNLVDVAVLRVTAVRNPYFVDDRVRYEGNPNFDIIVTSKREINFSTPAVVQVIGAPSPIPPGAIGAGVFVVPD